MNHNKDIVFKPVTPQRASDYISYQIKEMIFSGVLKPDDRLPAERELAVTFQTGRMTVREALRMLEESGFVRVKQGADGGTFVKKLDASGMTKTISGLIKIGNISLKELTEARVAIESLNFESVIKNMTPENLNILRSNIEACESLPDVAFASDGSKRGELVNFHLLVAGFSANSLLRYFTQSMVELSTEFIVQYAPDLTDSKDHIQEHRRIFDAIAAKNLADAQAALKDHLFNVAENIDAAMRAEEK